MKFQTKKQFYDVTDVTHFPNLAEVYGEFFNTQAQGNA